MCKFNPKNDSRRIDPCIKGMIEQLNAMLNKEWEILSCCCGHGKYPLSIVCQHKMFKAPFDLVSNKNIHNKKKFYKKDKQGYYYIPEVLK